MNKFNPSTENMAQQYLFAESQLFEAIPEFQPIYASSTQHLPYSKPDAIIAFSILGRYINTLIEEGDHEELLQRIFTVLEQIANNKNKVAQDLVALGTCYQLTRKPEIILKARKYMRPKTLQISEEIEDYASLGEKLVHTVPELLPAYQEELEWWRDEKPGLYNIFSTVLTPYLISHLKSGTNTPVIKRIFMFIEKLAKHKDERIRDLVAVEVCEPLEGDPQLLEKALSDIGPRTRSLCQPRSDNR